MTQYIPGKAKLLYDLALHFWAYTQTESWTAQKSLKNWQMCYITIKEICATKEITPEKKKPGGWEKTGQGKSLPHKHEDLIFFPRKHYSGV